MSLELFSNISILFLGKEKDQVMQLTVTQYRGIVMHLTHPEDETITSNLNEELVRYVTNEFKQQYNFLITSSPPSSNKSFRIYMIDKSDFLHLPLYKYKNNYQKTHAYRCVLHDFYLRRTYELNGFKTCTLPSFVSNLLQKGPKYKTKTVGKDIVSVEILNEGLFTFPFDTAHCYSNEKEITSSPMTTKDDPEEDEEKWQK